MSLHLYRMHTYTMNRGSQAFALLLVSSSLLARAEDRFGRPVLKLKDGSAYGYVKVDDIKFPLLKNERYSVTCLVYRGTQHYYVETSITNNTSAPLALPVDFVQMEKPGYTITRGNTLDAAREAAAAAQVAFVPVPAPYVPATYKTTINATANTYGNQTYVSGTATTTVDNSGQAGANLGNAIGNAIAAHRFYKVQRNEIAFYHFLASHLQTIGDSPLSPGETRTLVAVFDQAKPKKKALTVHLAIGSDKLSFEYRE